MNKFSYLSKSDFQVARECRTKLWYKKKGYPSTYDYDEYMHFLADGGFMIGKMAQIIYPGGFEINEGTLEEDIQKTEQLIQRDTVTLFEPAIFIDHRLVRVDVFVKNGNHIDLIEVKSKSFSYSDYEEQETRDKKHYFLLKKEKRPKYIEDVTYQYSTLLMRFPDCTITPYLLLPDKDIPNEIDDLIHWFQLVKKDRMNGKKSTEVAFSGDEQAILNKHFLHLVDVSKEVAIKLPEVEAAAKLFIEDLQKENKFEEKISCLCKGCEYRVPEEMDQSGFKECWEDLADVKPHILELGQLGNFNRNNSNLIDNLIIKRKVSISDVPTDILKDNYSNRPYWQATRNDEFLQPGFFDEIKNIQYPLHFIDFETSRMSVPYHKEMHSWGLVLFQWSCHTIDHPGAVPIHKEWINVTDVFPNFKCAQALKEHIGIDGTFLIWSPYENSVLKEVFREAQYRSDSIHGLDDWINEITWENIGDDTRLLDMHELCKHYYFHPMMGGRTSIKVVLPAVLSNLKDPKILELLEKDGLLKRDEHGHLIDPYSLLSEIQVMEKADRVHDGTGAMRTYQDMLYGEHKYNSEIKEVYKNALTEYCKLDTLAMVIIWKYWEQFV